MKQTQSLLQSFANAFVGISTFFTADRNGKIHIAITLVVLAAGFAFKITAIEWMIILLCIAIVIALEMMNNALEKLCDKVEPDHNQVIKIIKDVSAAAVLWTTIISIVIGLIIFIPKAIDLIIMAQ